MSLLNNKKKIVILGGGIGGLSVAHELTRIGDFDITIIERNSELGGQARSKKNSRNLHSEYCWHAIGHGYCNFLNLLKEIKDKEGCNLLSHIKPIHNYIYVYKDNIYHETYNAFLTEPSKFEEGFKALYKRNLTFIEKIKLHWLQFKCLNMCEERMESLDSVKWNDYIKNFSPEIRRWLLDSSSIYFGMDYSQLSTHFMIHLGRQNKKSFLLDPLYNFYSLDGPMNEILFDNWQRFLEKKRVKILLNTNVISLETDKVFDDGINDDISDEDEKNGDKKINLKNKITHIFTEKYDKENDIEDINMISADIFINSLGVESISQLYPQEKIPSELFENKEMSSSQNSSSRNNLINIYGRNLFSDLARKGRQIQTQVLYYIPYRLQLPYQGTSIYIMHDTKWFLMMRLEGDLWNIDSDLLSLGIGMWDVKGENGKTALECTREELAEECWKQLMNTNHNLKLSDSIPEWDIWFSYNNINGKISTYEPKFSNNINTLQDRPCSKDRLISNLFHSTAYNKTGKNVFNMESACEAGRTTAQIIVYGNVIDKNIVKNYNDPTLLNKILRKIDKILYKICKKLKKIFSKNLLP